MKVEAIIKLQETGRSLTLDSTATFGEVELGELIVASCNQLLALIEENLTLEERVRKLEAEAKQLRDCGVC